MSANSEQPLPVEPPQKKKQPVMHALGQSLGILWKAIREPVKPAESEPATEADTTNKVEAEPERFVVEQETRQIEHGKITLRETTIREIEVDIDDDSTFSPTPPTNSLSLTPPSAPD